MHTCLVIKRFAAVFCYQRLWLLSRYFDFMLIVMVLMIIIILALTALFVQLVTCNYSNWQIFCVFFVLQHL